MVNKSKVSSQKKYALIGFTIGLAPILCAGMLWLVNRLDDIEKWTKLIETFVPLLQAMSWPLVVFFILFYFDVPLKKFLTDMGEFSFKAGTSGLEATAKRQQVEAAALLGAASARKSGDSEDTEVPDEDRAREIANVVTQSVTPKGTIRLAEASVLWVDDNPANNRYERKSLEAFGIRFTISTSTDDALERIKLAKYDVIISDMGRPEGPRAGYDLLEKLQKSNIATPFIIYSSSNRPEHKAEAYRRGAFGSTNNPRELFQLVLNAIQNS